MTDQRTRTKTDSPGAIEVAADRLRVAAHYDFIVCGAGSSGSVVARRLAECGSASVLLVEAGGSDQVASVTDPALWPTNLGSERDWGFVAKANPHVNGRAVPMSMGKALGGGSSINVMVWARGHRSDWDFFASETGDLSWGYDAVIGLYRQIEDWHGAPDGRLRGTGGPVWIEQLPDPSPIAHAMLGAAGELGIPTFDCPNGSMMEGPGGCAPMEYLIRGGRRCSIFQAYVRPWLDRPNLTVLAGATVERVILQGKRATGVALRAGCETLSISAGSEVILSLGAIHTPKVLMLSGIGDQAELGRMGIPAVQHLPGVGRNLQDHVPMSCIWAYKQPIAPRGPGAGATLYWKTDPSLEAPDLLFCQAEAPMPTPETATRGVPAHGWTMFAGFSHPKSRGEVRLRSADPRDSVEIETNALSHPDDLRTAIACVALCREIGNAQAFAPLVQGEAMPGNLSGAGIERFVRDAAATYWHQSCTAKMGRDALSVVDGSLKVYGMDNLRVADASVLPRITSGNTMAPCVVIGERAAQSIRQDHGV